MGVPWSDEALRSRVADAMGQAVIVTDLDGQIVYWNAAAEQLFGWPAQEVIGANVLDIVPSDASAATGAELLEELAQGARWEGEYEIRHRDGHTLPILVTNAPLRDDDGKLVGIVGVSADLTPVTRERERTRQWTSRWEAVGAFSRRGHDLRIEEMLQDAVDTVATELGVPLCKILELTPTGDELLLRAGVGWKPGIVGSATVPTDTGSQAGYTLHVEDLVVVEDLATETRFTGPDLLVDHGVVSGISTVIRGRGTSFGVLGAHSTRPHEFSADDVYFVNAIARVLGGALARNAVEQELRETVRQLERSEEIRLAFLRATSHELRTPLTVISGIASTLQRHDGRLDASERTGLLDRLAANADRLTRLIQDLLDVDQLSTGLVTANRQPHDLHHLIARVADELDLTRHRLEMDLEDVTTLIDAPKFERVVANLLSNAARHTPPGTKIRVELRRDGDSTLVRVDDEGPGIDEDYLEHIFKPFVQGRERHADAQPGSGLGLSLVSELVRLHDGVVTATNRPGGGSRFDIRLPDAVDDSPR